MKAINKTVTAILCIVMILSVMSGSFILAGEGIAMESLAVSISPQRGLSSLFTV